MLLYIQSAPQTFSPVYAFIRGLGHPPKDLHILSVGSLFGGYKNQYKGESLKLLQLSNREFHYCSLETMPNLKLFSSKRLVISVRNLQL